MSPRRLILLPIVFTLAASARIEASDPIEHDTGRPRPAVNGQPVLGSGLAMSRGSFRGVPVGELPKWTLSLWFRPDSPEGGDLIGVATHPSRKDGFQLFMRDGKLHLEKITGDPKRRWSLELPAVSIDRWQQIVITCTHESGPAFYLGGKKQQQGRPGAMGYSLLFDEYYIGKGVWTEDRPGRPFDGLIDDFALYDRALSEEEVAELHEGKTFSDSLVAFNDFEDVSHREYAVFTESDRDEMYLDEGKKLYEMHCVACHSKDGITPPLNPLSRFFSKHPMENGGDPFSMFRTVTYGFRNMMPATQLAPAERYKVIHYIRERLIREHAPNLYVAVPDGYADAMPLNPETSQKEAMRLDALAKSGYLRDYGGALTTPVQRSTPNAPGSPNALVLDLGNETTMAYDLGTMQSIGAWTGGFLDFSNTLHHKLRAPGLPTERFEPLPASGHWRWAWGGKAETPVPDLGKRTLWPRDQMIYRGYYTCGDEVTLSFSIQGRGVLESPLATQSGATILHHRLTVDPGDNALEVILFPAGEAPPTIAGNTAEVVLRDQRLTAWLQGDSDGPGWRISEGNEVVLTIPPSAKAIHLNVATTATSTDTAPVSPPEDQVLDLTTRTGGGPLRWTKTHTLKGKLATGTFQGYAMDSVPVPLKNAYNSWMRTASLAFFPDGRLAVATLAGDVWIVSGIDESLGKVTWKRFAAGLYEPLGMKVVDGVLTAITRGRIVKLHDLNSDGEADFYEAFFNEDAPDRGWHAYNFDLEVGDDGSLYYARTGGFSDWEIPGGVVRVSKDGLSSEVVGVGLRVPNGIGKLPDGRITLSDNQGTYVPASKISITSPGGFHGAGKWDQREGRFDPSAIIPPIVYMPQELDSSSGSQLWVEEDPRFGPLSGHLFHASFGRARTLYVMMDMESKTPQGAVFSLPIQMESGTLRIAKNPRDGQLYYSGLTGWQAGGSREGSIQRLRYTGEDGLYLLDAKARKNRIELTFNHPLDEGTLEPKSWKAEAWNYRWGKQYGSPHFKVSNPEELGADSWSIAGSTLSDDGKRLTLHLPRLQPCHTLRLDFDVSSKPGFSLGGPVYFTIHDLPE